jgi:integrase
MSKYCPENERVKRDYTFYLEAANGKQNATVDAALRAIERFEASTNYKQFRKFHIEQARSFRARLAEETNAKNRPLSAATVTSTLKHLRSFFLWLSREPGFRSALNPNDANYFTPSEQDVRVATARREKRVATLEEIRRVLALMPTNTDVERRDRAIIAFVILTGARDGRSPRSGWSISTSARRPSSRMRARCGPRVARPSRPYFSRWVPSRAKSSLTMWPC